MKPESKMRKPVKTILSRLRVNFPRGKLFLKTVRHRHV